MKIMDNALVSAATLSHRYISDRFLPDKAIDLIDEAASRVKIQGYSSYSPIEVAQNKLNNLLLEKERALIENDLEKIKEIKSKQTALEKSIEKLTKKALKIPCLTVEYEDVAKVVTDWTGVPVDKLIETESIKLLSLEDKLKSKIIGQDNAIELISGAIRRGRIGLKSPDQPTGSFIFVGPTGVGKTEKSLELAEQWGCPIVSADSRQIYRDLPIGTAAPSAEEQARVKHYFIGTKDLHETYNAGQYARDCKTLLSELFKTHERVLMVGGSMMYIDAVCKGLDDIPDVPEELRNEVRKQYAAHGLTWLQEQVAQLDPNYWEKVDRQNPQRLMHCVEICQATGKPYSSFRKSTTLTAEERGFDVEYRMVERPREELYERINLRVHKMIEAGLLEEARSAFEKVGVMKDGVVKVEYENLLPNSLNTVGYKELIPYFKGEYPLERAIELIQQNSRHYAKRQMTWWRAKMKNQN